MATIHVSSVVPQGGRDLIIRFDQDVTCRNNNPAGILINGVAPVSVGQDGLNSIQVNMADEQPEHGTWSVGYYLPCLRDPRVEASGSY